MHTLVNDLPDRTEKASDGLFTIADDSTLYEPVEANEYTDDYVTIAKNKNWTVYKGSKVIGEPQP